MPKDVLVMNHDNGTDGLVVFDNGAVIHWSEGTMVGTKPNGEQTGEMDLNSLEENGFGFAIEFMQNGPSEDTPILDMVS